MDLLEKNALIMEVDIQISMIKNSS